MRLGDVTNEEEQRDRKAQLREWSFVQFAPFYQKVLRVCANTPDGRLDLDCVHMWLDYLDRQVEQGMLEDLEDPTVQDGLLELTECYIKLEEARQTHLRRLHSR